MLQVSKLSFSWLVLAIISSSLVGCSLYQPEMRQGDYITQSELDQLQPGLTKHQVQQIMGSTALTPVFNTDQWNYSYAYVDGQHRDQPLKFRTISLFFNKGELKSYSSRDWHPAHLPQVQE